ncbi:hypothetical protein Q4601_16695 [Shewanella sp. 1_MG-2023]|uniref:Uncharacterized protein n=1 Tax=Shewanella electrodiphila TaxID=934143 RepID=A0ABT0KPB7_9GAMM|nr:MULTISPECIES: hypothetical protein [Shewanella]MCC4834087.1 hypothetical protein [Shewanella sp. 10N.7]MCL1045691.1 hypothetical protein [Shewanella electrodiphila]MDO6613464.1 hypothetical protein [Shewanella sp. 7_MG-2023]MDO6773294.1 hypothetical protein [Shewanella sp. 2_MG-2023]MDO6795945.1 hypothetical protein [Shewanella sp. 1_MG-2023]
MDLMMIFHLADPLISLLLLPVISFIICSLLICGLQWYQFKSVDAISEEIINLEFAGETK